MLVEGFEEVPVPVRKLTETEDCAGGKHGVALFKDATIVSVGGGEGAGPQRPLLGVCCRARSTGASSHPQAQ